MKKYLALSSIALASIFSGKCGTLTGSLYTNVVGTATIVNKDRSSKEGLGTKTGEACATSYLGLVATGDARIKAAAKSGENNNPKGSDICYSNILGSLYVTRTIVHGN